MRADLHLHTVYSADSLLSLEKLSKMVVNRKIDCVAITDHNTITGAVKLLKMKPLFRVIIGEEISTKQGEIIGLFLEKEIPAGLDVMRTIEMIREQKGLVMLPHPCDRLRHHVLEHSQWEEVIPLLDMIEGMNGRTVYTADDRSAQKLAGKYHKPLTAGSDGHTMGEVGCCGIEIGAFTTPAEFLQSLTQAGFYGKRSWLGVHVVTKAVKWANKAGWRKKRW